MSAATKSRLLFNCTYMICFHKLVIKICTSLTRAICRTNFLDLYSQGLNSVTRQLEAGRHNGTSVQYCTLSNWHQFRLLDDVSSGSKLWSTFLNVTYIVYISRNGYSLDPVICSNYLHLVLLNKFAFRSQHIFNLHLCRFVFFAK